MKVLNSIFVFVFSLIYSLMEIEIEGKHGWCKELPTAKNVCKDFTLYHLLMNALIIITFTKIFYSEGIFDVIFYTTGFFLIEDFLWFVLNPNFTIKKYTKENIPWHKEWMLGIPTANFVGLGIFIVSIIMSENTNELATSLLVFLILTILAILVSPFYHKFYYKIRNEI